MKPQRGIDGGEMIIVEKKKSIKTNKKDKVDKKEQKISIENAWG
jgi:hypothetical protein